MRTTLILDDALMRTVYAKAGQEHRPIKDVVNELLERGLAYSPCSQADPSAAWVCPTHDLGGAAFDYAKAWSVIDAMEAEAVADKVELRK